MQGDRLIARLKPVGEKVTPDEGGRLRFIDPDRDERLNADPPAVLADLYRQRVHSHERVVGGIERPVAERLDLDVQVRGLRSTGRLPAGELLCLGVGDNAAIGIRSGAFGRVRIGAPGEVCALPSRR